MSHNLGAGMLLAVVLLAVLLVVAGPLLVIWSANTLFPVLAIPYTWQTWLATILLVGAIRANVTVKR